MMLNLTKEILSLLINLPCRCSYHLSVIFTKGNLETNTSSSSVMRGIMSIHHKISQT